MKTMKMMFIWLLAFTFIVGGIGEFEDICKKNPFRCFDDMPEDYPLNKEELDNGCRAFQDGLACFLDVMGSCNEFENEEYGFWTEKRAFYLTQLQDFLKESCNPESLIYQVFLENLVCTYMVFEFKYWFEPCYHNQFSQERKNVLKSYEKQLMETAASNHTRYCLERIYEIACKATVFKDGCGADVLLPLTELFSRLDIDMQIICDQDMKDKIPLIVEAFAFAEQDIEAVGNEIRKK